MLKTLMAMKLLKLLKEEDDDFRWVEDQGGVGAILGAL